MQVGDSHAPMVQDKLGKITLVATLEWLIRGTAGTFKIMAILPKVSPVRRVQIVYGNRT